MNTQEKAAVAGGGMLGLCLVLKQYVFTPEFFMAHENSFLVQNPIAPIAIGVVIFAFVIWIVEFAD